MLRDLTPEVIDHILTNQFFGRLGCAANGQVLVLPTTYLYERGAIYGQTYEGTKTQLLRQNPAVCFEVDEVDSPTRWRSVVVQGIYEELTGEERLYAARRLGPGRRPPQRTEAALEQTDAPRPLVLYRVRIVSKSGRSITKEPIAA